MLRNAVLDTSSVLTEPPRNVLVLQGENAVLNCSSNLNDAIEWKYDGDIIVHHGQCSTTFPGYITTSRDPTECDLEWVSGEPRSYAGAYVCNDNEMQAIAMIIVLGK